MKKFTKDVTEQLQQKLGENYEITPIELTKLNDSKRFALVIREKDSILGATIYIDSFFQNHKEYSVESIAQMIVERLAEEDKPNISKYISSDILDFERVKDMLYIKLVNKAMNEEYLKDKCFIEYLDLAIIFYVLVDDNDSYQATTVVTQHIFNSWNKDIKHVLNVAMKNTVSNMPVEFKSLDDVVKPFLNEQQQCELDDMNDPIHLLYILTNEKGRNGSSTILYENVLRDFSVERNVNKVVILPSSIHEVLLVPWHDGIDSPSFFKSMVHQVNDTEVDKEEILSYNVYIYELERNEIRVWE